MLTDKIAVPTLTKQGFIKDNNLALAKLYFYYIASEYSQSTLYYKNIASLQYNLQEAGPDKKLLIAIVRKTLMALLNKFWSTTEVELSIEPLDGGGDKLLVVVDVYDSDGTRYSLKDSLVISNSRAVGSSVAELDFILKRREDG